MTDEQMKRIEEMRKEGRGDEPIVLTPEQDKILRVILGIPPGEASFDIKVSTSACDTQFESQYTEYVCDCDESEESDSEAKVKAAA
jgi:hypothetical protein